MLGNLPSDTRASVCECCGRLFFGRSLDCDICLDWQTFSDWYKDVNYHRPSSALFTIEQAREWMTRQRAIEQERAS